MTCMHYQPVNSLSGSEYRWEKVSEQSELCKASETNWTALRNLKND